MNTSIKPQFSTEIVEASQLQQTFKKVYKATPPIEKVSYHGRVKLAALGRASKKLNTLLRATQLGIDFNQNSVENGTDSGIIERSKGTKSRTKRDKAKEVNDSIKEADTGQ